jgi:hypothetical protein
MNQDQINSLIRSLLKIAGSVLVARGLTVYANIVNTEDVAGLLVGVVGLWQSHEHHGNNAALVAQAFQPAGSGDFPVPSSPDPKLGTGSRTSACGSPEPAEPNVGLAQNVCPTPAPPAAQPQAEDGGSKIEDGKNGKPAKPGTMAPAPSSTLNPPPSSPAPAAPPAPAPAVPAAPPQSAIGNQKS